MRTGLAFFFGLFVGAILGANYASMDLPSKDKNITLFEQPGEVMESSLFKVSNVLDAGHALAIADADPTDHYNAFFGITVLFLADENSHYYDDQIIEVPRGKKLRQVGIYKYKLYNTQKTIPIVKLCDK